MALLAVFDETMTGERVEGPTLEFLSERVTVRELIRSRVYQEVTEHNARRALGRGRLVEPASEERLLNGERPTIARRVDWEKQYELALRAFEGNGFLLFIDDRQLLELDDEVEIGQDAEVSFLRLVPLVGG